MFKSIKLSATELEPPVVIYVDGAEVLARPGLPLATALLAAGIAPFRKTAVSGAPRAPLCLMGVCFDCLLEVDGTQNVQSCMIDVRAGMQVRLQNGARRVEAVA